MTVKTGLIVIVATSVQHSSNVADRLLATSTATNTASLRYAALLSRAPLVIVSRLLDVTATLPPSLALQCVESGMNGKPFEPCTIRPLLLSQYIPRCGSSLIASF